MNKIQSGDIFDASQNVSLPEEFFDYLGSVCKQELIDKGTPEYDNFFNFEEAPDLLGYTEETMNQLIEWSEGTGGIFV